MTLSGLPARPSGPPQPSPQNRQLETGVREDSVAARVMDFRSTQDRAAPGLLLVKDATLMPQEGKTKEFYIRVGV
jgi:hypothetical protein